MAAPSPSALTSRTVQNTMGLVTRRTYRLPRGGGELVLADDQVPLVIKREEAEEGYVLNEPDLVPLKRATDVVVIGSVHAPDGEPVRRLQAACRVGGHVKKLQVLGDRKCTWRRGQVIIPDPEPFTEMPLSYTRAYGGSDEAARHELDRHNLEAFRPYTPLDLKNASACVYHRNFVGKGFITRNDERIDGLVLPNLEDPDDPLTPQRLVPEDPFRWWGQPLPAGLGWFDASWFPRCVHMGMAWNLIAPSDNLPGPDDPSLAEVRLGHLAREDLRPRPLLEAVSDRLINGASPGLVLPHMRGDEQVTLTHLDPDFPELDFRLPGELPRLFMRPLDEQQLELQPRLYSVIVDLPARRVSLVWGGWHHARFPHGPKQLERVPFRTVW